MDTLEDHDAQWQWGADAIEDSLRANLVSWRVRAGCHGKPLTAEIRPGQLAGGVRLIELSGDPFIGEREQVDISNDGEEYVGVLLQRTGTTICDTRDRKTLIQPGEVCVWLSGRPARFEMPTHFRKLCMIIPVSRFENVLHHATSYEGLHLPAGHHFATLLSAYLTALALEVVDQPARGASEIVDVTLELLGAAFRAYRSPSAQSPRSRLTDRILRYIEVRLEDTGLTPQAIAEDNGISLRYLYLLFNERGMTVAGWIRQRRLERCRAELADGGRARTVAEIAYHWGFSDSAHFSRLFKSAFGISPSTYKSTRC
ncbi:helix-turn-helix domain-containing protein [Burkholderia orbicola]|uniref:helix-turn-helix domain-containing protein n=1 Tax=Burkholderia orbicola TaxID=2978683 RepID=UPI00264DB573|nr:helix-turn-helix domain-containing protein [Burkholderia orbicola]MDN7560741.1 helix-turn-helix domain-containing protein [Burkholderia orbicola]